MNKEEIKDLGNKIVAIQNEAVLQTLLIWKPKAENIIITKSKDINDIEQPLDALCEDAFNDKVLIVFKKLCRYYYDIDPQATAEQIQFYREIWDNENTEIDG